MRSEKWPIWPVNSKPARPIGPGTIKERTAYVARWLARGKHPETLRWSLPASFATYEHVQRARCIGEGLVRARRRARFVAWLERESSMAFAYERAARAYERAARFPGSPEVFVMKCSWRDLVGICWGARFSWEGLRIQTQKTLRLALLASPEWAALPWQREAP